MPVLIPRATIGLFPTEASSTSSVNATANIYGDHNGLTDAQIGIMVGCIVGFTLIVLTLIFCVLNRKRQHPVHRHRSVKHHSGSYTPSVVEISMPPPSQMRDHEASPREWIPGGPRYPTYKAIPIRNPRKPPAVRHKR